MSDALEALRAEFPTLRERVYFAGQCLGAFPEAMLDDLDAYASSLRSRSRAIPAWVERWEELHRLGEQLLEAAPGSVYFRDSATAVHAALFASIAPEGRRDRILVGAGDFHSIRYLVGAQRLRGFEVIELDDGAGVSPGAEDFVSRIDERVRVVAVSMVSPRNGALLDVRSIVDAAHAHGAIVVLDAYQAIGIVPVRVRELEADAVVGGFHKRASPSATSIPVSRRRSSPSTRAGSPTGSCSASTAPSRRRPAPPSSSRACLRWSPSTPRAQASDGCSRRVSTGSARAASSSRGG